MALQGTAIITGGNGLLGSEIVVEIAKRQPFIHLLVVARDLSCSSVKRLSDRIHNIGARSLEIARADLADFSSVTSFAEHTIKRVKKGEIPPIAVLVNCAAAVSYTVDEKTIDGFDPVYQVNCLSPFLLAVNLLEGFRAGTSMEKAGACVINVGCAGMSHGVLDFFDKDWEAGRAVGTTLDGKETLRRYGSSKLVMAVSMYALRRSLISIGHIPLDIFTVDPGMLSGRTNRMHNAPISLKMGYRTRSGLGVVLRLFSKTAINTPRVPAKVIADIAFRKQPLGPERYFILDDEYEASSVVTVLRDVKVAEKAFKTAVQRVNMAANGVKRPV